MNDKDKELNTFLDETKEYKKAIAQWFQELLKPLDTQLKSIDETIKGTQKKENDRIESFSKQIEKLKNDFSKTSKEMQDIHKTAKSEFNNIANRLETIEDIFTISGKHENLFTSLKGINDSNMDKLNERIRIIGEKYISQFKTYIAFENFYLQICEDLSGCKNYNQISQFTINKLPDLLAAKEISIDNNIIAKIPEDSKNSSRHWWGTPISELRRQVLLRLKRALMDELQKSIKLQHPESSENEEGN